MSSAQTKPATHAHKAEIFCRDEQRVNWHSKALWTLREKRDRAASQVPEWETLRKLGSHIKQHSLSHLADYLTEFESNCIANGIQVHWAKDAQEHNQITHNILAKHQVKKLVKSKSMLTEECHLNPYLEQRGIEVIDTDLGERIIQLAGQAPSHIVVPAIHLKKQEVGDLFHEKIGTQAGASDPTYLTRAARAHLREQFLSADAAMTGVNMAIADQGGIIVCTNEGNADMGVNLPSLQLHSMGIDKVIPNMDSAAVLLRTLARNATGQLITTYSSCYKAPKPGGEMHVIIVDNGRSEMLKDKILAKSLKCIRCGGCLNTCPVYRRSGGHSYNYTIPGPIGIAVGAQHDETHSSAWACTLCGSCSFVCPTKVPLDKIIAHQRYLKAQAQTLPYGKRHYMPLVGKLMANKTATNCAMTVARTSLNILPHRLLKPFSGAWGQHRELPQAPKASFDTWFKHNRGQK
ncbi:lactate utilization protein B [Shewanella intestini]|uniref:Lactate utilization protein n=1 Tax=Shewanella intestini TaxID=2017544 RepID=A0ABS5HY73_9GAMM|nr:MULTISPECIES: lactate utilization protein B [Shewanella]MBR9726718.1 lactate utilization protein [Shewanella intestini]MRG34716.1 4Fe-4S dicluster domain-containing protein [Shewanella sp. XMDDZSB0408]